MQVLRQKTYSVEMTEEELRLFSEFLEEREYSVKSAMKGAVREARRAKMAEQMLDKMNASKFTRDAVMGSPSRIRRLTSPITMKNGTYIQDLGASDLNVRITNKMRNPGSWTGVHGTTMGNQKVPR